MQYKEYCAKKREQSRRAQYLQSKQHQMNKNKSYPVFINDRRREIYLGTNGVWEDLLSINATLNIIVDFHNLDEKTEFQMGRNHSDDWLLFFKDINELYESSSKQIDVSDDKICPKGAS